MGDGSGGGEGEGGVEELDTGLGGGGEFLGSCQGGIGGSRWFGGWA